MKKLLFPTLVVTSALAAVAAAQTPARAPDANPRGGRNSDIAELQRTDADEAKLRTDLDAARKRLDERSEEHTSELQSPC